MLAAVVRGSLDALVVIDEGGRVVEWNPAAEATFGYSRAQVVGQPIADLIIPDEFREAHLTGMARYLGGGEPRVLNRRVELEACKADGTIIPVELAISEVALQGRRLFTASLRDLSEQRRTLGALRESEAMLTAFFEHAPAGMLLMDREGRYLRANAFAAGATATGAKEFLGKRAADFVSAEEAAEMDRINAEVLAIGKPSISVQKLSLGAGERHAMTARFPIRDGDGRVTHLGAVLIDITELVQAENELRHSREALHQSEKMTALGSLLAGVSHELNNPLAIVVGESILLEEEAEETPFAEAAARIRRSAERCARIVQTFLAMARQKTPERVDLDLNEAIQSAVELTAYAMRSNGVEIQLNLAAPLPLVAADGDQLQQVLINLLVNAQQALQECDQPRVIAVNTGVSDEGDPFVRISDNGPGIPPETARRIFEPFFTTKPQGTGTGIGLSFSHGVMEAHGGTLALEEATGGASFLLTLPASQSPRAEPAADDQTAASRAAEARALIIDDEAELAEALGRMLAREGYSATVAVGGQQGLDRLAEGGFDLILSDLRMPDVDGPAIHRWLSVNRPEMVERLAFVTGDTLGPAAVRFLNEANRPFIEKPFTRASIRQLLAEIA